MAFLTRQFMLYPNRFLGVYLTIQFIIWNLIIYLTVVFAAELPAEERMAMGLL